MKVPAASFPFGLQSQYLLEHRGDDDDATAAAGGHVTDNPSAAFDDGNDRSTLSYLCINDGFPIVYFLRTASAPTYSYEATRADTERPSLAH